MNKNKPQLPSPEVIQRTVENWQEVCRKLDALNELLDRANSAFEEYILSNPTTAYRLRGVKPKPPKTLN
ncbi:MAG: hypothetical protein DSM107014_01190 [Gomphosphaeria aponina SAG 52.96 = DSM 107014]|uniref:Uncharacterized protein n=1 Tax=Gomphosphaeria aponina SAG 52.96 = DSM 107014 TaxID=1521640 RepID=A0A941GR78_9CHRO|nr:hypothetical protein [Gomphosphaeria aponina SAG 52.96 = DSM 107014]